MTSDMMQVAWVKPELNKIFGFIHVEEKKEGDLIGR